MHQRKEIGLPECKHIKVKVEKDDGKTDIKLQFHYVVPTEGEHSSAG